MKEIYALGVIVALTTVCTVVQGQGEFELPEQTTWMEMNRHFYEEKEQPFCKTIITAEQIQQRHYTTVKEAVAAIPGVTVSEQIPGGDTYARLQGTDRVVVLVDGQNIGNTGQAAYGRGTVDLSLVPDIAQIERIEVMQGVLSVRYGSGAVGGVIHIITKKGAQREQRLDVFGGTGDQWGRRIAFGGEHQALSWYVTGSRTQRSYYPIRSHGIYATERVYSDYMKDNIAVRIRRCLTDQTSLDMQAQYTQFDGHGTTVIRTKQPYTFMHKERKRKQYRVQLAYQYDTYTMNPGYVQYYQQVNKAAGETQFSTRTQGVRGEKVFCITAQHKITLGGEWRWEEAIHETANIHHKRRTQRAFFLEDEWKQGKWTLLTGVRGDDNSYFGFYPTARVSVLYDTQKRFSGYASWGRVFSVPKMNDLFYTKKVRRQIQQHGKTKWVEKWVKGDPSLRPENGYTATLGMTYRLSPQASLQAQVFRNEIHQAIRWNHGLGRVEQLDTEAVTGGTLSFFRQVNSHWQYSLGYGYTDYRIYTKKGIDHKRTYNRPHGYVGEITYTAGKWRGNLSFDGGAGRDTTDYNTGAFVQWNGNVQYAANDSLLWYVEVRNINNAGYDLFHQYPVAGRQWLVGMRCSW